MTNPMHMGDGSPWSQIEWLYRREAMLLQSGQYATWLRLFAPEVAYRAPVVRVADHRSETVAGPHDLAYFDEDFNTLTLRVRKFASTMAWTEYPPSRTRYFFMVLEVQEDGSTVAANSNFLVYQTRHDSHEHQFFGERRDVMRRTDDGFLIVKREIILDRSRLGSENISIFL